MRPPLARVTPRALFAAVFLTTVALAGCGRATGDTATEGAPPVTGVTIGPVPGPGMPAAPMASPVSADAATRMEGRQLFTRYNCAGCHGEHAGGGMGPSLRDSAWIHGGEPAQIFASIAEGRPHGMPAWGTKLPEQQVWTLVTYIQSLRTRGEPEPPR